MDPQRQIYEQEASGWQRGLYADIRRTFRAPFVNWIFRTLVANEPDLFRHAWFQVKPAFGTRGFAEFSVAYRDAILGPIEDESGLRTYRCEELETSPAEYRELGGQLATFDILASRLAVLFDLFARGLEDDLDPQPDDGERATAPFPPWLDRDRGTAPTMAGFEEPPADVRETVESIRRTHGLGEGLPSIHRCLAQWPGFLESAWTDLRPVVESDVYEGLCTDTRGLANDFIDSLPYRPRLAPDDLRMLGFATDTIDDLRELLGTFGYERPTPVLPTLVLYPAIRDVAGPREL